MDPYAFHPEPSRTAAIDLGIRRALAESVTRIIGEAVRQGFLQTVAMDDWTRAVLDTRRAPPQLWAHYHDLVQAILRGDAQAVPTLAAELVACRPDRAGRPGTVLTITDADLGPIGTARHRAVIDSDPTRPLGLRPAEAGEVRRIQAQVDAGRALLDRADPALLDEIDALGHQIVLATNAGGGFGGGGNRVPVGER